MVKGSFRKKGFYIYYRTNRKGSTSLLLQKASHDIDMAHYLIGEHFDRVTGMGALSVYGGTKGRIESNQDESITLYTQENNQTRTDGGVSYSKAVYGIGNTEGGHGGANPKMCKAFLDYLIDDIPPRANSYDGLKSVTVGIKGADSIRNHNKPLNI